MNAEKPLSTGGPEDRGSIAVSIAEGSSEWGFPAGLCLIEEHPAGEACRLHSAAAGEGSRIFPLQGGGSYDPKLVFPFLTQLLRSKRQAGRSAGLRFSRLRRLPRLRPGLR